MMSKPNSELVTDSDTHHNGEDRKVNRLPHNGKIAHSEAYVSANKQA